MRKTALLPIILAIGLAQNGNVLASGKGTSSANFLTLGAGARAIAMGEAVAADPVDATSIFWNPAGLAVQDKRTLSLMHSAYLESSSFDHLCFVQPLGRRHAVGASLQYFTAGDIERRNEEGIEEGSFKPSDAAFSLAYAVRLAKYALGVTGKMVRSKILHTANTNTLDVGILSPRYGGVMSWGISATNLFGELQYQQTREKLPRTMSLGTSFQLGPTWKANVEGKFPNNNGPYGAVGVEHLIPFSNARSLALRLGYNSRTLYDVDGVTGISMGIGFGGDTFTIDYGLTPTGSVGLAQALSLTTSF